MNALLDQSASNVMGGSWWNPSRAVNAGLSASSFAPSGISQFLNLGYGAYNGFKGLTSQNNEGFWGNLDPTEPGLFQNAGNWLGSGIANLLGYGTPQMSMAQGQAGNNQSYSSGMNGMQLNANGSPSNTQLDWVNHLPSLNYTYNNSAPSSGGWSGVGYAPGADFMSGFGSQGGGYESGGGQLGLRINAR